MTRLMIAVVIAIVMAVLAIQNQEATALTILGARQTPEIPFGLLLVGAFSIGALLTLFLYGIVGLQRPPESKYKPMGRRVPYPESPNSATIPPSGPATESASPYATATQSYSSSTAFVSDSPPQDTSSSSQTGSSRTGSAQTGSSQSSYQGVSRPSSSQENSSWNSGSQNSGSQNSGSQNSSSQNSHSQSNYSDRSGSASPNASSSDASLSSGVQSSYTPPVFPDVAANVAANPAPSSVVDAPKAEPRVETTVEKKKSRFNPLGRKPKSPPVEERRVGDDWGELRTAEHLNSWEAEEVRRASGVAKPEDGRRGFLDFIGVGTSASTPPAAERLTDDIATGWDEGRYAYGDRYAEGSRVYEDDLDSGWEQDYAPEGYIPEGYIPEGYIPEGYIPKGYAQERTSAEAGADFTAGNAYGASADSQRRVYRDGLYSDNYSEGPYDEGPYEAIEDEEVYEADYRVIVPPSKSLEEIAGKEEDDPYV